ncbi:hypothetical protein ACIBPB_19935 [Micromonospora sp. NPDC049836]|uniref:hypothetical protein n=1 Tax=Micromonospora sp. NPDC049836 TaxID=3364274 RepID=UPI00378B2E38
MSIAQFIADTIDANRLTLALHGFPVEVDSAEPAAPAVHVSPVADQDGVEIYAASAAGKVSGLVRVVIAYPAGQVFPLEHFRAEVQRIIGKPQSRVYPGGGSNMQYRPGDPYVISHVADQADGRTELTLSLGCIAA